MHPLESLQKIENKNLYPNKRRDTGKLCPLSPFLKQKIQKRDRW